MMEGWFVHGVDIDCYVEDSGTLGLTSTFTLVALVDDYLELLAVGLHRVAVEKHFLPDHRPSYWQAPGAARGHAY